MLPGESELNRHQQAQAVKKKALPLNELAVNWEGGEKWGGRGGQCGKQQYRKKWLFKWNGSKPNTVVLMVPFLILHTT